MTERGPDASSPGDEAGPPELVVAPTVDGLATALTHMPSRLRATAPERSHPAVRPHPPLVTVDPDAAETTVPGSLAAARPDTEVHLALPADREHLFVAAPLAYYLGAAVSVGADQPRLSTPGGEYDLDPLPAFQHEAAALLRDVFTLDALVRDLSGEGRACRVDLVTDLGLCPAGLRGSSPGVRLDAYLGVDRDRLAGKRPEWHLSTYADPTDEALRCLPFLLDALSLVYLPESSDIDEQGLLRYSLDDFYRCPPGGRVASVDVVEPTLHSGELHAWLAEGVPVSAFTLRPAAFEHRRAAPPPDGELAVAVVLNDGSMAGEHDVVADTYRKRAEGLPASVSLYESLRADELADLLETPHDFVHYIGHCEVDGLRCPDGSLDCASLSTSGARTFFLNACGSFHQGRTLVDAGSIAGAVTLRTVLNEQAATVGTTFARLLMRGFGIERAMQLARRQIMMSTDYTVVGDGTFSLTDAEPSVLKVEPLGQDGGNDEEAAYAVTYTVPADGWPGGSYRAPFEDCRRLRGTTVETTLNAPQVRDLLEERWMPVVHDGSLHWSDEFLVNFT
ncbi:hypothetical protein [Halomarina litorea]|uniref:hypothetical protein n=1 Tax=Halomarina litorea TaxID=2961595 RepID=UPI0020C4D247|nr:hypothetical protein [Halomarina sp. BCD28]